MTVKYYLMVNNILFGHKEQNNQLIKPNLVLPHYFRPTAPEILP